MTQKETNVWKNLQLRASELGHRLLRNQRYKGRICRGDRVTNEQANCGVGGDGGHDLIGWRSFVIQPEDVGKRIAQYLSVEAKTKGGPRRPEQENMVRIVREAGGLSGFAENNGDLDKILSEW